MKAESQLICMCDVLKVNLLGACGGFVKIKCEMCGNICKLGSTSRKEVIRARVAEQ